MGFFSAIFGSQPKPAPPPLNPRARPSPQRAKPRARVRPQRQTRGLVGGRDRSHAEVRGWRAKGNQYFGAYKSKLGTFQGAIENRAGYFVVLIKKPPMQHIDRHEHSVCFFKRDRGWYEIHLSKQPANGDHNALITYVERLLNECAELARNAGVK